ncbi:MAG TPA: hypothetical protein VIV60_23305 [Polyangiaceae bacterium]
MEPLPVVEEFPPADDEPPLLGVAVFVLDPPTDDEPPLLEVAVLVLEPPTDDEPPLFCPPEADGSGFVDLLSPLQPIEP